MEETPKLTFDPKKILVVSIDLVRPNTWNPKKKGTKEYFDLVSSIKVNGLEDYIIVRENNGYEILDGENRWTAAKQLGIAEIVIYNLGIISDADAVSKTLWKQVQIPFDKVELKQLIKDRLSEFKQIKAPFFANKIKEAINKEVEGKILTTKVNIPMPKGEMLKSFSVQCTTSQYEIVMQALNKARDMAKEHDGNTEIMDSKALEFVCIEFINQGEAN